MFDILALKSAAFKECSRVLQCFDPHIYIYIYYDADPDPRPHQDPECEILNQIKFSAVFPINLSQMLWQISRNSRLKTNMSSLINNFVFPKLSSLEVQVLLFAFFTHWLRIQQVSHFAGPNPKNWKIFVSL